MKHVFPHAIMMMLLYLLSACHTASHSSDRYSERSIVILHENDVHCNIEGYASIASLRDAITDTAHVAVVSCGDYLQGGTAGAISGGQFVADVMRSVGYDAVTLGNHEFDYGTERMFALLNYGRLPVTCLNLRSCATGKRPFSPFIMRTYGTKRVAFIGVVTPNTLYSESYAFYDELGRQEYELCPNTLHQEVQEAANQARKAGADYVVVLAHLGEAKNSLRADSHSLIAATRGIDALLDGHTHSVVPCHYVRNADGIEVPVSQTGTKMAYVGKLVITSEGKIIPGLVPDSVIKKQSNRTQEVIDSVNAIMKIKTEQPVCHSRYALKILDDNGRQAVRYMETNAGDIVTDAYRELSGADVAVTNGGGIRNELPAGHLTYGDIISLLPYENNICVVEVTGEEIIDMLESCCQATPQESGDFPQVSGMKFTIDTSRKPRISDLQIYDKKTSAYQPVELTKRYSLATIDYCISGGGLNEKLKNAKILKENLFRYSDIVVKYIKENLNGEIPDCYAAPQGRITIIRGKKK